MTELEVLKLDVFAESLFSGNPTWVVFDADTLDEIIMQRIAYELGSPETVFVMRSKKADVKLRFFNADSEEPISGHSTIGALWAMADQGAFGTSFGSRHRAETSVGILPFFVELDPEGTKRVWMTQKRPMFSKVEEVTEVASALGIGAESIFLKEFPMTRASTGLPCLLVAVRSLEVIEKLNPRQNELVSLCKDLEVGAVAVYVWGGFDSSTTVHARCFLPTPSYHEDPASGMPAGALASYIADNDFIPRDRLGEVIIEQGHFMGRPSKIYVRIEKRGSTIKKVDVGGSVRPAVRGKITVP